MKDLLKHKAFLHLFPTPEYLLLSNCGLSISDENIKLIKFNRGFVGDRHKLSHYECVQLPPGTIQSGFINDSAALTTALKGLANRYGLTHVYATLPEERAYLFSATIDQVPREGLVDAVAFIIEENVPVSLPDSVFDFDVVEELRETNQIKVTVSVLSRKVVDFYIQVLESAGLTPVSFDVESQAIARAIIEKGDKRTQLVVNLGLNKTGLYVVEDEIVQFTTTLPYGVAGESAAPHFVDLKSQMRKIFTFWITKGSPQKERKIERVILCGPGAYNEPFAEELMVGFSVPHTFADPWVNTNIKAKDLPPELVRQALDYLPAIGSALPHLEKNHV